MSARKRATARAAQPVSDEINRAAERAGIELRRPLLLAAELREMHAELGEVIDHVIGSRLDGEFERENFEEALVKLRSVRICLDYQARNLDRAQAVAS